MGTAESERENERERERWRIVVDPHDKMRSRDVQSDSGTAISATSSRARHRLRRATSAGDRRAKDRDGAQRFPFPLHQPNSPLLRSLPRVPV
ncbi:unnamed protein product, partial [Musa acuminata subsp. malaccensis]|uniref:(wild Malaysian banana) hypothetical protein n=1 Tax=Musa acuminata subsp. malaccensis TaxID=214687 RepID=A0A804J8P7_MUSAM